MDSMSGLHPGSQFDLKHWKLTLPTNAENGYEGKPREISGAELTEGFNDPHFYLDSTGSMVFWCPVVGATTEGTKYPRSELREMPELGDPHKNWVFFGSHELSARCRVIETPSNPKIVIGQIHSYKGQARPLVKLQYFKGRIEALVKESPNAGRDLKLRFPDVELGSDIDWNIKLSGGILSVIVNGTEKRVDVLEGDKAWEDQTFYFKAGVYPMDNDGDITEGARVSFSSLKIRHEVKVTTLLQILDQASD
ncbi:MAG: polysaccharide lyase family 7 protein [Planctomycetota bacterium]